MGNVSTASFGTPLSLQKKITSPPAEEEPVGSAEPADYVEEEEVDEVLGEADETADPTVVLSKLPAMSIAEDRSAAEVDTEPEEVGSTASVQDTEPAATTPQHRQKLKVTTELERIVVSSVLVLGPSGTLTVDKGENLGHCRGDHNAWSSIRCAWQEHQQE